MNSMKQVSVDRLSAFAQLREAIRELKPVLRNNKRKIRSIYRCIKPLPELEAVFVWKLCPKDDMTDFYIDRQGTLYLRYRSNSGDITDRSTAVSTTLKDDPESAIRCIEAIYALCDRLIAQESA